MKKIIALIALASGIGAVQAEKVFQASLTPEIAIYPRHTEIRGLSLDVWGENPQHSLNLGLINGSTGDSGGFTWGIVNYADSYTGIAWGLANYSRVSFTGWQDGWVNAAQGNFKGLQTGWIANYAENMQGLQLGFVNYAENLRGVQLGFLNVAMNNPWFNEFPNKLATGFPILNWSF
jgi:hypothetical protein